MTRTLWVPGFGTRQHQIAVEHRHIEVVMSKGMDQKKSAKKQPLKTPKEKRAAKQEKKAK
ncbi:MAG: hypothetical protein AB7E72_07525 [Lysobacterales bacterium]